MTKQLWTKFITLLFVAIKFCRITQAPDFNSHNKTVLRRPINDPINYAIADWMHFCKRSG